MLDMAVSMPFAARVDLGLRLVEREDPPKAITNKIRTAWNKAKALSERRNEVAHNPLVFGWVGEVKGEPHFIGVPNLKVWGKRSAKPGRLMDLQELKKAVDDCAALASDLQSGLEEMLEYLESRKGKA